MKRIVLLLTATTLLLTGCKNDNSQIQAESLLEEANTNYERGAYDEAQIGRAHV